MEIFASRFESPEFEKAKNQREADLVFAFGYLSFLDLFLSDFDRGELRFALSLFPNSGTVTKVFQILNQHQILNEDQLDTILGCLFNQVTRTRLIAKISAKNIFNPIP